MGGIKQAVVQVYLAFPGNGDRGRRGLGVSCPGLGRVLGMGSRRDRFVHSMAHAHSLSACCSPPSQEQIHVLNCSAHTCSSFVHTCAVCCNRGEERALQFRARLWRGVHSHASDNFSFCFCPCLWRGWSLEGIL